MNTERHVENYYSRESESERMQRQYARGLYEYYIELQANPHLYVETLQRADLFLSELSALPDYDDESEML